MQNAPLAPFHELDTSATKAISRSNVDGNMCFAMEYYRERLPLECPGGTLLSAERGASPRRERLLIFADSGGICPNTLTGSKGFMAGAPEDRVQFAKVISTHPSELTEKEMIDVLSTGRSDGTSSQGWDIIVWGYGCENAPGSDIDAVIKLQENVQRLLLSLL
eukprot:1635485-Prymnesium_polylepis.1